jgi:hypothetical protein
LWSQYNFYYSDLFAGQLKQSHETWVAVPATVVLGWAVLWSLSAEEILYPLGAGGALYDNQAVIMHSSSHDPDCARLALVTAHTAFS